MQKLNEIISDWLSKTITVSYKSRLELYVHVYGRGSSNKQIIYLYKKYFKMLAKVT